VLSWWAAWRRGARPGGVRAPVSIGKCEGTVAVGIIILERSRVPASRPHRRQSPPASPLRQEGCAHVLDEQTHPHRPRLVVSHSTCPPLSFPPHTNSSVIGPAVIKHTWAATVSVTGITGGGSGYAALLAYAEGVLYGTEHGSVTLKRVVLFCFSTKILNTHTELPNLQVWEVPE